MLDKDPEARLGSKNGLSEILKHEWLADFDVDALERKELDIDISEKPNLSDDPLDLKYFTQQFKEED